MNHTQILSMQPTGNDSRAIIEALDRIEILKADAIRRAADAEAQIAAGALTLTSKARRILEDENHDAALDVRQAEAAAEALHVPLKDALASEAYDRASASHAATTARLAADDSTYFSQYLAIEKSLIALMKGRTEIEGIVEAHNAECAAFPNFKINVTALDRPLLNSRFFLSDNEIVAERLAEQSRRTAEHWARIEQTRERHERVRLEYANRPALPDGPHVTVMPG